MNYLKNFLFSVALLLASQSIAFSAEREDLYKSGNAAFEKQNYVIALKNLHTFLVLNEESLENHPKVKSALEQRIKTAESVLSAAMASNPLLSLSKDSVIIRSETIGGGFSGTGKEIEELIRSGQIDLQRISQESNLKSSK